MIVGSPTKLNLIPSGVMPVVYINQGDAGYDKEFLVYNGDSPYNVPAGVSATIRGKKADGYGVTEAAALTTGSNLVTVTITEQMVAAEGANLYELVFVDTDGLRIATINMVWAVKADALGDSVISDSDLDYATTVMNQLQSVQAFKNQLDTNTDGLAAETAARIAADDAERVARIAADNALQNNISAESAKRANADTVLQAEIDQLIAPSGSAPSAAEVQNARIGADGVTYPTLGDAIRGQVGDLYNDLEVAGLDYTSETKTFPDASGHSYVTGTGAVRYFLNESIPENSKIYNVSIPIGGFGAGAWISVEVWEVSADGLSISKVLSKEPTLTANTTLTVELNYTTKSTAYIAYILNNAQAYFLPGQTGYSFLYKTATTKDAASYLLSDLYRNVNTYIICSFNYKTTVSEIVTDNKLTDVEVSLPWRHGALNASGTIYFDVTAAIMTDLFIPTASVDYINRPDTAYSAIIGYFNSVNGHMIYQTQVTMVWNATKYVIDKTYDYFVCRLFKDWNTNIEPATGNEIINAYVSSNYTQVKDAVASAVPKLDYERLVIGSLKKKNIDFISIAHQGFSYTMLPGHNLIDGYVNASLRGFDYGETDLRLTSDNVLVCCHDDTFTDATTSEVVTISSKTYLELQAYNYYGGKIASFDDVVKTCKMNGIGILIDQLTVDRLNYAIPIITKYGMWNKTKWFVVYKPDDPTAISDYTTPLLNANPCASLYVVAEFDVQASIAFAKTIKTPNNEVLIHLSFSHYTVQDLLNLLPTMGDELGFSVYTIDSLSTFKEYMPYVKAIISNQISTIDALTS